LLDWVEHAGPIVFFSMFGLGMAVARRSRELGSIVAVFIGVLGYILIVGGDWMSYYRFMAPAEPYCFLLAGAGVRQVVEYRDRAALVALAVFGVFVGVQRVYHLDEAQKKWMKEEKRFWDVAAGQTATFLADRMPPGRIAIGDIGYVGYKTNYPVLDLLGLVDREIAALPGGYTRKLGRGFRERFFDTSPEYAVLILSGQNCNQAAMEGSRLIFDDPRFKARYELAHNVQVNADAGWCVFKRHDVPEAK
jgi:hypothetical protein